MRRLLGLPSRGKSRRDSTVAKIEALGFKVDDLSGWHEGKFAFRRYRLIDPSGAVLDNHGDGYASSSEAYRAARVETEKLQ